MHLMKQNPTAKSISFRVYSRPGEQGKGFGMVVFGFPSWLTGAARTLDLGGVFDPPYTTMPPALADSLALAYDLKMVQRDLLAAFDNERDSPRTRLLSERQFHEVRLEMIRRDIANRERIIQRQERLIARKRRYYAAVLQEIDVNEKEETANSRPEIEPSWAG